MPVSFGRARRTATRTHTSSRKCGRNTARPLGIMPRRMTREAFACLPWELPKPRGAAFTDDSSAVAAERWAGTPQPTTPTPSSVPCVLAPCSSTRDQRDWRPLRALEALLTRHRVVDELTVECNGLLGSHDTAARRSATRSGRRHCLPRRPPRATRPGIPAGGTRGRTGAAEYRRVRWPPCFLHGGSARRARGGQENGNTHVGVPVPSP